MKEKVVIFLLLQMLFLNLQAQDSVQEIWDDVDQIEFARDETSPGDKVSPWSVSTSLGTSYGFSKNAGSFMNLYLAPQLQYAATNRLMIHGGFIASHVTPLYNTIASESNSIGSYMGLSAFVAASYRLTEDFVVYGTGMKSMLNTGMPGFNSDLAFDDISFGAAYTIGNFTIGASFHTGQSNRFNRSPINTGPGFYPSSIYW